LNTLQRLGQNKPPSPLLHDAITQICELATAQKVSLLFDAEQSIFQEAIDDWTLQFMQKYNNADHGAVIFNTYQAYLKAVPEKLVEHLQIAEKEGYRLGVKLVRGAYIGSDPRELIFADKSGTDRCYDDIAEALITRKWNKTLQPHKDLIASRVPLVDLVIASHNKESVIKAQKLQQRASLDEKVQELPRVVFGQLLGMADDLSCQLVINARSGARHDTPVSSNTYKYLVWGSTQQCLQYLVRRAQENKDAVGRTVDMKNEVSKELKYRFWNMLGHK
jgi:proline dehydrogenase